MEERYPIRRNLDGCYFRIERDGEWGSFCFSDLTDEERARFMASLNEDGLKSLCCHLADTIRAIGDQLDICCD